MRIVQLVNALQLDQLGGLQRYVEDFSGALAARGHDVTVVTKRLTPELPIEQRLDGGVRLIRTPVPPREAKTFAVRYPVQAARGTARVLRRESFDVIHAHFALQAFGCRLSRRPYLYTFHAPAWAEATEERGDRYAWPKWLDGAGEQAYRAYERTAIRGAAAHIVLSEFMAGQLRKLAGANIQPSLVPGGVRTDYFHPGEPESLRDDPWSRHPGPVLFSARRLVPRMGIDNLVRAIALLRDRGHDLRLAVAGTGMMREELLAVIGALQLGEHVRLLGRVPEASLRDWYRRATLVVLPTVHLEGFGLTTAEALACGTPVIGTPAGATPELLRQVDPALISGGTTPEALAEAIARLLARPRSLGELGVRGREVAVREWSWASVAERHEQLYGTLSHHSSVASSA